MKKKILERFQLEVRNLYHQKHTLKELGLIEKMVIEVNKFFLNINHHDFLKECGIRLYSPVFNQTVYGRNELENSKNLNLIDKAIKKKYENTRFN